MSEEPRQEGAGLAAGDEAPRPGDTQPLPLAPDEVIEDYAHAEVEAAPPPERAALGAFVLLLGVGILAVAIWLRDQPVTVSHHLLLSMLLFAIGAVGVLMRRSAIVILMCVELMLNAVNLAFVVFARMWASPDAHAIVLFVMIVAAAEVAVGLAIVVSIFMRKLSADVDGLTELRG